MCFLPVLYWTKRPLTQKKFLTRLFLCFRSFFVTEILTFYISNGNEVGKLVHRQGKKKGYNLILNLPRCVRQNNIQPFSVLDADKIYDITTIVVKQLKKCLKSLTRRCCDIHVNAWNERIAWVKTIVELFTQF